MSCVPKIFSILVTISVPSPVIVPVTVDKSATIPILLSLSISEKSKVSLPSPPSTVSSPALEIIVSSPLSP